MTSKPTRPVPRRVTATSKPAPVQVRKLRPPIPAPPELQPVHAHGTYMDTVSVVPRTLASLHLMPGRLGDGDDDERRKILLPFAEMRLGGDLIRNLVEESVGDDGEVDDDKLSTLLSANLPLENFAYVLLDLTGDLKRICEEISGMGDGELSVDPARMAHVRYYLAHIERQSRLARLRLDTRYGPPEVSEQQA